MRPMRISWSWLPLVILLAATLLGAMTFDREDWPGIRGDEATYLMAAQSLAWDYDLEYSKQDFDRFVGHWQHQPEGLILQKHGSADGLTYGKPALYPLVLAPFLRLSPLRGPFIANALLLALAGFAAAVSLRRSVGAGAPVLVAAFLFASVSFAHVFWVHADLFLMSLVALALSLAYGGVQQGGRFTEIYQDVTSQSSRSFVLRWLWVGILLGVVALSRPFYGTLLLPAALAVPAVRRRQGLLALTLGAGALVLAASAINFSVRGTWSSYGGERQGFYSYTGFPEVDLPADRWQDDPQLRGASWVRPGFWKMGFDLAQTGWNVAYSLVGRHVGILPYFLPFLIGFFAFRSGSHRWSLLLAVALALSCFFYLRPFNFWGGGDSIGNRYFLPLYPAFWFLASGPRSSAWAAKAALAVALVAGPFLWPLWSQPRAYPVDPDGGYHYVSALAERWLPYETTQSHLKPSGHEDLTQNGLWVKPLTPQLTPLPPGSWLHLEGGAEARLLLGFSRPLDTLLLDFRSPPPARLEVEGGDLGETAFLGDGTARFQIVLPKERARHRMWWTNNDVFLYTLSFHLPPDDPSLKAGATFQFRPGTPK
ncbi:MAG: hypothetical protein K0U98_25615 [Deltaproteobacteria bacterium]|nr:hypothetical protein [Deltaproteobacteria bacterium]